MGHRFRPRLSACVIADQAIFLDLESDRYFSLAGPPAQAVKALLAGEAAAPDSLARLMEAGLVRKVPGAGPLGVVPIATPTRSLLEEGGSAPPWRLTAVLDTALSIGRAHQALKRRPLHEILEGLQDRRLPRASSGDMDRDGYEVARAYLAARRLAPVAPKCLADSLALLDQLLRRGCSADLVFGVKLHPFSAHCWVQARDVVFNDAIDHVTLHTPILVV